MVSMEMTLEFPVQLGFGPGSDRSVLPAIDRVIPMYFILYKMLILYLKRH